MTTRLDDVVATVGLSPSGLVLDGEEEVLLCASLFYFRLPREVWGERLAKVRASGYRVIDVYLPWNFHEVAPGEWDFTGRRDVAAFLDLAHEAGLAVIARPGPYICSEWDGGALPAWLPLTEGLAVRQAEPRFLDEVRRWFDQALPILADRQHGRGGSVIAVQLENELDFFDTLDRPAYLTALRDMALGHGITVPLVACAGQGDLAGATGDVDGVAPACNFYPDDRSAFVEPEARRYTALLAGRGLPLMVTETNRAHVTLRRLLVSGARVLAPYLQASGFDFGYTPSTGNWGTPGGFMTHDYDFGGFLSPTGEARPEIAQARALAAVVRTLGPRLARATAEEADGAYRTTAPTSASPSRLLLDGGGTMLGLPNLGPDPARATLPATGAVPEVTVDLPAMSCTFVTRDLPLEGFGLPGTLVLATADLVGAGPDGLLLAAGGPGVLGLSAPDGSLALVEHAAPETGAPVRLAVQAGAASWDVTVLHAQDAPGPDGGVRGATPVAGAGAAARAGAADGAGAGAVAGVGELGRADASAPERIELVSSLTLPTRTGRTTHHDLPPSSEEVGAYRGRTHYAADVVGLEELLVEGASDIVDLALDGVALPSVARFGATETVAVAGSSRLTATVETWGHANFDDSRLPALRLGSLRGLGHVWSVSARTDVTGLWTVEGERQWAGEPAPLRSLGGWSSTRLGRPITYRTALDVDGAHHHALHLEGLSAPAHVEVDGEERLVTPENPWVHLAPGEGRDVAVTVTHAPGVLRRAALLRLAPVRGWEVEAQPDRAILELASRPADSALVDLPLRLAPGEEAWVQVAVPPGGLSVRLDGTHVRVSAFAHGELLGRVWLEDAARPRFTGGDPERLWLPAAWNDGTIRLLVHATAGGSTPTLAAVLVTRSEE